VIAPAVRKTIARSSHRSVSTRRRSRACAITAAHSRPAEALQQRVVSPSTASRSPFICPSGPTMAGAHALPDRGRDAGWIGAHVEPGQVLWISAPISACSRSMPPSSKAHGVFAFEPNAAPSRAHTECAAERA